MRKNIEVKLNHRMSEKTLRTCAIGHKYYKRSDCLVCPICESKKLAEADFLQILAAPARRALEGAGITTLESLSKYTEKEILALHGIGPASLPKLREVLAKNRRTFK